MHQVYVICLLLSGRACYFILRLFGDPIFSVGVLKSRCLLLLVLGIWGEVVNPGKFESSDQEVNTPLESFDACQLGDSALLIEMLDPALELPNFLA